jgi:hypothetical protein
VIDSTVRSQKVKGTVYALDGDLVFVKTTEGGICWFEQLCGEAKAGDVVSGDLVNHGRQNLSNETSGRTVGVLLEGYTEATSMSSGQKTEVHD